MVVLVALALAVAVLPTQQQRQLMLRPPLWLLEAVARTGSLTLTLALAPT
jgi:hypothetical protein